VTVDRDTLVVHEAWTGKQLREFAQPGMVTSFQALPDGRHFMVGTWDKPGPTCQLHIVNLNGRKILNSWAGASLSFASTADARVLFVKAAGDKAYHVWDVATNQPSTEVAELAKCEH